MIEIDRDGRDLSGDEVWLRVGGVVALAFCAVFLRVVEPENVPWLAMQKSCGAWTGLPCIFCGTTRAVHLLLNGDFARAVYFNWLAFPVVLLGAAVGAVFAAEVSSGRRVVRVACRFAVTPRIAAFGATTLVALWALQVGLALAFHKQELFNHSAPLYALFVR